MEAAQTAWAARPVAARLRVLRKARTALARVSGELVDAMPDTRTPADSYVAEVLPLLDACEFLEREAVGILEPRKLGKEGLPFWLRGIATEVERVPLGRVLVIGPANYPLFLPGVQVLQALAAGNAVTWKPGREGGGVAAIFERAMTGSGLPEGLLRVTGETVAAAVEAMAAGVDKVFFTGSEVAGREVMRAAAETGTPVVAELSGCDAVVVLGSAEVERVVAAVKFGMRLNGSATCMAPRRLVLVGSGHERLVARLREEFEKMEALELDGRVRELVEAARLGGAQVFGDGPVLLLDGRSEMDIARADVFAPVLTVLRVAGVEEVARLDQACPFGLTVAVFGEEREARRVGMELTVGTVMVNDLIVPAADPRVPFGGRRGSGFGVTRGREGLLEMTAVRVVAVRRSRSTRHYEKTGSGHEAMFRGVVAMSHGRGLRERFGGVVAIVKAALTLR